MRYLIFRPSGTFQWHREEGAGPTTILANANYLSEKNYEAVDRKGNHVTANANQSHTAWFMVRESPAQVTPWLDQMLHGIICPESVPTYICTLRHRSHSFSAAPRLLPWLCPRNRKPGEAGYLAPAGEPKVGRDKIKDAMENGQDQQDRRAVPSDPDRVIFYATAFVDEDERSILHDIYTYDKMLEDA